MSRATRASDPGRGAEEDADSVTDLPVPQGLATAGQVRRLSEVVQGHVAEEGARHAREEAALSALQTSGAESLVVQRATLSGIERLVVTSEERARYDAERRAAADAEAERSRQWWRAMWDAVTSNRLVQILVLVGAVLLVPELRPLVATYLGLHPAPAAAPAPEP